MKITSARFRGFKRFRYSEIKELSLQFPSAINIIIGTNSSGKAMPNETPVKVPGGWKHIGHLRPGDKVIAVDGTPTIVTDVFPQGRIPINRVDFVDGRSTRCCDMHLWRIHKFGEHTQDETGVCNTALLLKMQDYMQLAIPLAEPEQCPDVKLPIDPAVVGQYLHRFMRDPLHVERDDQGSLKVSPHKIGIPEVYLNASPDQKWALLGAILQVPVGKCNQIHPFIELHTPYVRLARDIQYLVRSLGCVCKNIYFDNCVRLLMDLSSKELMITRIIPLETTAECTCIKVAHRRHLFVANDFIVTHNSSLLRELCPLPAVRTDYEPGQGLKELNISHEGHQYRVISDFSSRTAPHHFLQDGHELNVSGTTDVQTELVEKYFGITAPIRDLIYSKTRICNLQKAQRKTFFLNTNPLELGLILEAHKRAMSRMKDCRANLQMLYTRKTDLEGKLLKPDILYQHKKTKEQLSNELVAIDKILYSLEQHISTLKDRYRDDLAYRNQCSDSNRPLVPIKNIVDTCKEVLSKIHLYTPVKRGAAYTQERNNLKVELDTLTRRQEDLSKVLASLSEEINEYQKHLDNASKRPASNVEKELKSIDEILAKYKNLPSLPIPANQIDHSLQALEKIRNICFIFRDTEAKLRPIKEIEQLIQQEITLRQQVAQLNDRVSQLTALLTDQQKELKQAQETAGIPDQCQFTDCKLRSNFINRSKHIRELCITNTQQKEKLEATLREKQQELQKLQEEVGPYVKDKIVEFYQSLQQLLSNVYFSSVANWDEVLLDYLKTQPMKIVKDLEDYIEASKLAHEKSTHEARKAQLETELKVLMKTAGTSLDFLQKQLKAKEQAVQENMATLVALDDQVKQVSNTYNLYLEYEQAYKTIQEWNTVFDKGQRALMVSKAIKYWGDLSEYFTEAKKVISEELRKIETIVRDQEVLQATYDNEIMKQVAIIEEDKKIYEHIEMALSPNTGMPHRSMVKYLNAMINNVNYFLSQIWATRMRIMPIRDDEPLDYIFRMEISNYTAADISQLSDGQTDVVNLAWTLTILLQMKILNKIPFFGDELGRTLDPVHQARLLKFLNTIVESNMVEQLFLVNHFATMISGFNEADVICLNAENLNELPPNVNDHAQFIYY